MDMAISPVTLTTPLAPGALLFGAMTWMDTLSDLFTLNLDLVGAGDAAPRAADLLGQPITATMEMRNGLRHLNGIVTEFEQLEPEGRYARYRATVRPWLWLLARGSDCRIFQNLSVPDIVKEVLRARGCSDFEERLTGDYPAREFVVQYCESDYNFISRLLDEVGIYFFFKHDASKHTMVLVDSYSAHDKLPGYESVPYHPRDEGRFAWDEYVYAWRRARAIQPGIVSSTDFDFERPSAILAATIANPEQHAHADREVFDYPGGYRDTAAGDVHVRKRLEQLKAPHDLATGETNARGIIVGNLFQLANHPVRDDNCEYLVTTTAFKIRSPEYASGGATGEMSYRCSFTCMASTRPFRSPRRAAKPRIVGPQTAIVTGKSGEEIWTDQYGRVKVHFHWDRHGTTDEASSCWVRVAQTWAGTKWGSIHIPRIGQEVIVEFLDGDPDRPIITGRVYNGQNMPPYDLPTNQTQSGIQSRSSKGGSPSNFNEIRFEDKKGDEVFSVQAEKDMQVLVKHDQTIHIQHDQKENIDHDRTTEIGNDDTTTIKGNHTTSITKNDTWTIEGARSTSITKNDTTTIEGARSTSITKNDTTTIEGARSATITKNDTTTIEGARTASVTKDDTTTIDGKRSAQIKGDDTVTITGMRKQTVEKSDTLEITKKLAVTAGDEILLKSGEASVTLKKNGDIVIKGKKLVLEGSAITINGSDKVTVKGGKITQN
jgi:type VI secretion system secreted protein VgrG